MRDIVRNGHSTPQSMNRLLLMIHLGNRTSVEPKTIGSYKGANLATQHRLHENRKGNPLSGVEHVICHLGVLLTYVLSSQIRFTEVHGYPHVSTMPSSPPQWGTGIQYRW